MWACSKGQIDAALTLYHWNVSSLRVCNKDGHLPLAVARKRGHYNLATQVEQLEQAHFKTPAPAPAKVCLSIILCYILVTLLGLILNSSIEELHGCVLSSK